METVIKKISLEPFYSRQKSTIPFVGYSSSESYPEFNWGKIAYGVNFPAMISSMGQSAAVSAYGNGIKKLGSMTFQEIMEMYHAAVNNRLEISEEPTTEEEEELEKYRSIIAFVDAHRIIDEPKPYFDPCCEPCPPQIVEPTYEIDGGNFYTKPYAYATVCLVQSANLIGAYTFATKDWVPGKRYFEGDKVIYDGKTFKLKKFEIGSMYSGSKSNCEGQPLMRVRYLSASSPEEFVDYGDEYEGLSYSVFDEFSVSSTQEMVDMGYIYAKIGSGDNWTYYIRPSWAGFNNVYDGRIYFDTLNDAMNPDSGFVMRGQYNTEHWEIDDKIISHGVYQVSTHNKNVHISAQQNRSIGFGNVTLTGLTWESKLVNFKRNTKTMTVGGEELPGKLLSVRTSPVLDLQYVVGTVKNVDTTGDIVIGDYLRLITVKDSNGSEKFRITDSVSGGNRDSLENHAGSIHEGDTGTIEFLYYIGCELEFDDAINNYKYSGGDKGVIYKDTYRYTIEKYPSASELEDYLKVENRTSSFLFMDIDYDSAKKPVIYENIDNYEDSVILSEVTATTKSVTEGGDSVSPNFQNADYIMEDYQLGISFVSNNNTNVYVDRGTATAFERHMRLSEVDTLDDLVNYGNGMFKLKE